MPKTARLVVQTIPLSSPKDLTPIPAAESFETIPEEESTHLAESKEIEQVHPQAIQESTPMSAIEDKPKKEEPKPAPAPKLEPIVQPKTVTTPTPSTKQLKPVAKPVDPKKAAKTQEAPPKKVEPQSAVKSQPAPKNLVKPSKTQEPVKVDATKATPKTEKAIADKSQAQEKALLEEQKKKEAEQQALKAKQQKLLSEAQERIAKITQTRDKLTPSQSSQTLSVSVPSIASLQIEAISEIEAPQLTGREMSYRDELAGRLRLLLRLPEYGDVKIKLIVERSGKVAKVEIMEAESQINRKYIEKTLPSLSFPAFGNNFGSAQSYAFLITLSNE